MIFGLGIQDTVEQINMNYYYGAFEDEEESKKKAKNKNP